MQKVEQKNKTCEQCINCEYLEHGDMVCEQKDDVLIYENYIPTKDYMWCENKKFEER